MVRSGVLRPWVVVVSAVLVASLLVLVSTSLAEAASSSSDAPGDKAVWTPADKDGFGTSTTTASKVWYTLNKGELTEVYYPNLGTPSVRDLQFIVSDGEPFADLETDGTDPARSTLLVDVTFESLTGQPYQLYALYDPSLSNGGDNDTATSQNGQLLASDGKVASALVSAPGFGQTSSGYKGTSSDGWIDLSSPNSSSPIYSLDSSYDSASSPGNVVQIGKTTLTGLLGSQDLTLALGFGGTTSGALNAAQGSLGTGFDKAQTDYVGGWHKYFSSLKKPDPASVGASGTLLHTTYDVSVMTLAAHEDKTYRGAYVASPTMPWVWGGVGAHGNSLLDSRGEDETSGAYHLVWSRDLSQIATAL